MFPTQCPTADCLRHCFSNPPQPSCLCSLSTFSLPPRMMSAFPSKHSHSLHSASFSFIRKLPSILLQLCRTSDSLLPLQRSSSISSEGRKIARACGRLSHQVTLLLCQWLSYSSMSSSPQVSSALVLTEAGKSTSLSQDVHHRGVSHDHKAVPDHVQGGMGFSD